jgi:CheY-like chemotaxis protein
MGALIYRSNATSDGCEKADAPQTPCVLVVDDEKAMLTMVQEVLEDEGFVVRTAREGHEAVKLANRLCPDLIITDLMMPRMNGHVLRRILGSIPRTCRIPVVLMTAAYARVSDHEFAAVVPKPFQIDELLECVYRYAASSNPA